MRVELRGTIRASLGADALEVELPTAAVPLGDLLRSLAAANPRAARYLGEPAASGAALRVVHNGVALSSGNDPLVREGDSLLLLHAVAGG